MEKIKLFYCYDPDTEELENLEKKVNKWFAKNPDIAIIERIHTQEDGLIIAIYYSDNAGLTIR